MHFSQVFMDISIKTMEELVSTYQSIKNIPEVVELVKILEKYAFDNDYEAGYYLGFSEGCKSVIKYCSIGKSMKTEFAILSGICSEKYLQYENTTSSISTYSAPETQTEWKFYYTTNIIDTTTMDDIKKRSKDHLVSLVTPFLAGIDNGITNKTIPKDRSLQFYYGLYKAYTRAEPYCTKEVDKTMVGLTIGNICCKIQEKC
jgi:hypothetical protein